MQYIVQNAGDQQQGKKKQDADSGIYISRKKDASGMKLCRRAKMDIEKAIKWAQSRIEGCLTKESREMYQTCIEALREKAERDRTGGWISVEERLPKEFESVIIQRPGKGKGKVIVEAGCRDFNGWWKVYGTRTKNVTHWQPLPKPPKGAKE